MKAPKKMFGKVWFKTNGNAEMYRHPTKKATRGRIDTYIKVGKEYCLAVWDSTKNKYIKKQFITKER